MSTVESPYLISFFVREAKSGSLIAFSEENGSRKTYEIVQKGDLIANILLNEEEGHYHLLNVVSAAKYSGGKVEGVLSQLKLRKYAMITDQTHIEKTEVPMPLSEDKQKLVEAKRAEIRDRLMRVTATKETLLEEGKVHRNKTIIWVPAQMISNKEAYILQNKSEFHKKSLIPSLNRIGMYKVGKMNPTHVLAIGYIGKQQKEKMTYKGIVKAEYPIADWMHLHGKEMLSVNNPLVEYELCTLKEAGEVMLKTSEMGGNTRSNTIVMKGLLQGAVKNPQKTPEETLEEEFARYTPKNLAKVIYPKDGQTIYVNHAPDITLHGESLEKAIKRLGTVIGIDITKCWVTPRFVEDLSDNVDGLLGYMHPVDFLKYVERTCSREMYFHFRKLHKMGKLIGKQFTARVNRNGMLRKGNIEISSEVTRNEVVIMGASNSCPEIQINTPDWLHIRVGIKNEHAAVSKSLSVFIKGVFDCMIDASTHKRTEIANNLDIHNLHKLVSHLGENEALASALLQSLVELQKENAPMTKVVAAICMNRVLTSERLQVSKNLADGKFKIEGSGAGSISVITKYTDLGNLDRKTVTELLSGYEDSEHGRIYPCVHRNGTYLFSREAIGWKHVACGTCDFDDWFGDIPTQKLEQRSMPIGEKALNLTAYKSVFFRWPQGFREAGFVKVWKLGETKERKLYPKASPYVKPWEPGMEGANGPVQDATHKLFPSHEEVKHKLVIAKGTISWERLATHQPVELIGRFYNALVALLGHYVAEHGESVSTVLETAPDEILRYSTSDVVDLQKMGTGAVFNKVIKLIDEIAVMKLKVPQFLANHARKHEHITSDPMTQGWAKEITGWEGILTGVQTKIHTLCEEVREEVFSDVKEEYGSTINGLRTDIGHHYAAFLLQKWGLMWGTFMAEVARLHEQLDFESIEQVQHLENLEHNAKRVIFQEMQKSVDQIKALPALHRQIIGFGVMAEFAKRAGKLAKSGEYVVKGGAGFLASPEGFNIMVEGLKPIIQEHMDGTPISKHMQKGLYTLSATTKNMGAFSKLLAIAQEKDPDHIVFDSFPFVDEEGMDQTKIILVLGVQN